MVYLQTRRSSSGKCLNVTSERKATTWRRTADCSRTPAPSILSASPSCAPWSWWLRLLQGASLPTHTPTTSTPFRLIQTGKRTCPPMICGKQALSLTLTRELPNLYQIKFSNGSLGLIGIWYSGSILLIVLPSKTKCWWYWLKKWTFIDKLNKVGPLGF